MVWNPLFPSSKVVSQSHRSLKIASKAFRYFMMTSSNGNIFRVTGHLCGEFPAQRPVTQSFDVFFDLRLNKGLNKQSRGWWFETSSFSLWRHGNVNSIFRHFNALEHMFEQLRCWKFVQKVLLKWCPLTLVFKSAIQVKHSWRYGKINNRYLQRTGNKDKTKQHKTEPWTLFNDKKRCLGSTVTRRDFVVLWQQLAI